MPIDPDAIIRMGAAGLDLVARLVAAIQRARTSGDDVALRKVGDVLTEDELRSRTMLDDAERRVLGES